MNSLIEDSMNWKLMGYHKLKVIRDRIWVIWLEIGIELIENACEWSGWSLILTIVHTLC